VLAQRLELDPAQRQLFINFEGLAVDRAQDIDAIETLITHLLEPLGHRVVVNYHSFTIAPALASDHPAPLRSYQVNIGISEIHDSAHRWFAPVAQQRYLKDRAIGALSAAASRRRPPTEGRAGGQPRSSVPQ